MAYLDLDVLRPTEESPTHLWYAMGASMLVCAIVVPIVFSITMSAANDDVNTSVVKVLQPEENKPLEDEEPPPEPEPPEEEVEIDTDFELPDTPTDVVNDMQDEVITPSPVNSTTDMKQISSLMSDVASPVVMSGMMGGRTKGGRAAAYGRVGGGIGGAAEASIMKALRWLADNQNADGGWGTVGSQMAKNDKSNCGTTGMALLTFLAHGETPSSEEFGENVQNGIQYLLERQEDDGYFKSSGSHRVYGHAMATYALAEAYAMTQLDMLREPMEKGVAIIMTGANKKGGYEYDYAGSPAGRGAKDKQKGDTDLSVAAWQIQAMKACMISGANNSGLEAAFQTGITGLDLVGRNLEGGIRGYGYTTPKPRNTLTAAAALCLQFAGQGRSSKTQSTLRYLEDIRPDAKTWKKSGHGGPIYELYYVSQAKFHDANRSADAPLSSGFKRFYAQMVRALVAIQHDDGHWENPAAGYQSNVLNTTSGALSLMVIYRHLSTNHKGAVVSVVAEEATAVEDEDEIGFD